MHDDMALISEQETKDLIVQFLARRQGETAQETLQYYLVLTREIRMMQGILGMLESGQLDAEIIDGREGTMADDYQIRLTEKGKR